MLFLRTPWGVYSVQCTVTGKDSLPSSRSLAMSQMQYARGSIAPVGARWGRGAWVGAASEGGFVGSKIRLGLPKQAEALAYPSRQRYARV